MCSRSGTADSHARRRRWRVRRVLPSDLLLIHWSTRGTDVLLFAQALIGDRIPLATSTTPSSSSTLRRQATPEGARFGLPFGGSPTRPLETGAVNLVAGLLGREATVCAFGGGAVVDNRVDFAGDGHGNAVPVSELHDDAGGLDALSDLIHRRDDLVDRLARAELLADMAVTAALAGAGDDQIAHAGQPGEGVAVAARRLAHLGHLAHGPGHHHRPRVLANAE